MTFYLVIHRVDPKRLKDSGGLLSRAAIMQTKLIAFFGTLVEFSFNSIEALNVGNEGVFNKAVHGYASEIFRIFGFLNLIFFT